MKSTISNRKTKRACIDCHFLTNVEYYPIPEVDDANLYEINYVEVAFNNRERINRKNTCSESVSPKINRLRSSSIADPIASWCLLKSLMFPLCAKTQRPY